MEEMYVQEQEELVADSTVSEEDEKAYYPQSTTVLVSQVGYLIGVPKEVFERETSNMQIDIFEKLDTEKEARLVRNLCILRTLFERNYKEINNRINNLVSIDRMPELIPAELLAALRQDGVEMVKANKKINQYIIEINTQIKNHIGNCKRFFPVWLNWTYLRDIFIMPNGDKESGIREAANRYYANLNSYPYHMYINWTLKDNGNILSWDKKFAILLYRSHNEEFKEFSRVSDASFQQKADIVDFLLNSERTQIVVDCENSDPYKLYAMLHAMREEQTLDRIVKIVLYDDVNTSTAWDLLKEFTEISIEHVEIERVLNYKSYLDVKLATCLTKAHYQNNIDSFILFSSDSDYWGLIQDLDSVRFFVMVESDKVSRSIINTYIDHQIPYCYIDDFCTGNSYEFQVRAILREIRDCLSNALGGNIYEILETACRNTRSTLNENEKHQLYERYIKNMKLTISSEGTLGIQFGNM